MFTLIKPKVPLTGQVKESSEDCWPVCHDVVVLTHQQRTQQRWPWGLSGKEYLASAELRRCSRSAWTAPQNSLNTDSTCKFRVVLKVPFCRDILNYEKVRLEKREYARNCEIMRNDTN